MFIHRRGDGRMLFPTGLGGGNDSCSSRVSRRLMRHGVQPLMLSFHRSAMLQRRKLAKMRSKVSCENFGKFSITLLCRMELRWKRYLGKCVGGTSSFLRRDVSRRCLPIHPEGNAGHAPFLLSYCFSPLSLRRISALADMPRQVGAVFLRCPVFLTALRERRYVVRHGRAVVCGACTVPSCATDGRNAFRTFLRGSGSCRFERMRFHEKK